MMCFLYILFMTYLFMTGDLFKLMVHSDAGRYEHATSGIGSTGVNDTKAAFPENAECVKVQFIRFVLLNP